MQTVTPSLPHIVSCRHSRKVSCETLTQITVESHGEGATVHHSDDEKDCGTEGSSSADGGEGYELDSPSSGHSSLASRYLQQVRELERRTDKLDHHGYGNGKAPRHKFLACLLSKASHMPAPRRAKEVERLSKHLRAYPSAIHGTGGVAPHSGSILLPIGSQSIHLSSTKASSSFRASAAALPRNEIREKVNLSEPASPKVTCLGRVRNTQKHIRKCTSTTSEDHRDGPGKRAEKKNADAEAVESTLKKTSRMGLGIAVVADHSVELSNGFNFQKPVGNSTWSSVYAPKEERQRWSLRETAISHQNQKKLRANGAMAVVLSSSEAEFSMDLSRFGHEQRHEIAVGSYPWHRFEHEDKAVCAPAPPQNALLLIRNRKVMVDDIFEGSAMPTSTDEHGASLVRAMGDVWMDKNVATQISVSSSPRESNQVLPELVSESGVKKAITVADILESVSLPLASETDRTSSCAFQSERFEGKLSLQAENSGVCREAASFPKEPASETTLWQRRAMKKPCTLEIKKPVKEQINQPVAIWVNKK